MVTLYWLTSTFPRSIYPYREVSAIPPVKFESKIDKSSGSMTLVQGQRAIRPGISQNLLGIPVFRRKSSACQKAGQQAQEIWSSSADIQRYPICSENCRVFANRHQGGHFAALEQPKELWEDVAAFVDQVWEK
jgi:microsomal epoxide hydrolase